MSGTAGIARGPWWTPTRTVAFGLWTVLAAVVLLNSAGSFAVDTKPELYFAPWRSAAAYLSAWQANPQLGLPSFNVGLAPVAVAVGLIQAVGVSPALSVRVLRLLLLVLGSWGAARLYCALRRDGRRGDPVGPVVAGAVFVANPYIVVAGATQAILLPWALLPWQLLCLVHAVRAGTRRGWPAWRWPAGFALAFAAMSGTNAGVVPLLQLLAVPVVVAVLRATERIPWQAALRAVGRCAALTVAVSLYWVLPSLLALGAGATVVDNSETPEGIAGPSSAAEALRGLGLWPLYGSGGRGRWLPEFSAYLDSPVVLAASFALPVLAALGALVARGLPRRLGLALVAVAVPVMVGIFPPARPTPFGSLLRAAFADLPLVGAFRTTNKIGALLVLGVAMLVAAGLAAAWRQWPAPASRAAALGLALVLAGATVPAWTGKLYVSVVDLPDYWRQAAADLNAGPADQRVWLVPGEVLASYRWSEDRPDDLSTSVLDRPSLVRTAIPATSPAAANLLAALDTGLNEGTLPPGAMSSAARYLGVGDLLLRNDVVWEDSGGGRPQTMQDQLGGDPGLLPRGTWGEPGQNTVSPRYPPSSAFEAALPPLQRYSVAGGRPITRTEASAGTVLVDGDGWALAPLSAAGLLAGSPTFRYLADLTPAELADVLPETGRLVLTDTNRRRSTVPGRLGGSQGPLLAATADLGSTRALGGPERQTVLEVTGGSAEVTDVGSAFGPISAGAAENAVDGDPRTAWQFGDFNRAVGQSLTVRFGSVRAVPRVSVQASRGPVQISRIRLQVGDRRIDVDLDAAGKAVWIPARPVRADSVRVTVQRTSGEGFGLVGLEEVSVPGVRLTRVARLPRTLPQLTGHLDARGRAALGRTPVDVVLSRERGSALADDEETGLDRDLTLPVSRGYRAYGVVRPSQDLPERDLDTLAGASSEVTATSTSRAFGLPTLRASQALDGRPDTAWLPGEPTVGQAMEVVAPRRRVDHVDVTQAGRAGLTDWVTRVRVALDGTVVADGEVGPGRRRIHFAARQASRMRLTLLATRSARPSASVRISEVDFGGARIIPSAARAAKACVEVSTVDGRPLLMRPAQPITTANPVPWAGCHAVRLVAGDHSVRAVAGWQPDELVLRDPLGDGPRAATVPPGPRYSVEPGRGPRSTVRVTGGSGPWYLVSGQAYDPRWRASVDGIDLGAPVLVDGYAAGWRVDLPGSEHTALIWYGPQRMADPALATSAAAVLGCLLLLVLRAPPRAFAGRPGGRARPDVATGPQEPSRDGGPGRAPGVRPSRTVGSARGGRVRDLAPWIGAVVLAWVLGGLPLAAVMAAVAAWHRLRRPAPRTVIGAAAAVLAAVPVAWLALRPDLGGVLTARVVADNLWPHRLAAAGLLLLGVGVVRAERADPDRGAEEVSQ